MTKEELRRIRLAAAYKEMQSIEDNDFLTWEAIKGEVPYIEEYLLHISIRTYSGPNEIMDTCDVKLTMPNDFKLGGAPRSKVVSNPLPFNPEWFRDGTFGGFCWSHTDTLPIQIYRILLSLQFDPQYINPISTSNNFALQWYLENKDDTALFPSDNVAERFFTKYQHIIRVNSIEDTVLNLTPPKKQIEITISNDRGATVTGQLENTMTVDEVIAELIGNGFIEEPEVGTAYSLHSESYGLLHGKQTFEEGSVKDGETLSIVHITPAYGCPNSANVPGILPNCMLNDFDTIETLQL